tara:strand:- start:2347 stop:4047 length:1701 start_codon:yes stop_codon:yes gene_type:complete
MKSIVECVPNFSEGKDKTIIDSIIREIRSVEGISILSVDSGVDTNRTVVTMVGDINTVGEASYVCIKQASELIDMKNHKGTHPRLGATDVCPFIPISGVSLEECILLSERVGERVGEELKIPVYLYEKSSKKSYRKNLSDIRAGEYEGLSKKILERKWKPDYGPTEFNELSGATVIGCRDFLIAYNINLNTKNKRLATDIAFDLREIGRSKRTPNPLSKNLLDGEIVRNEDGSPIKVKGLFKDVKAIGWYVEEYGCSQISININNYNKSTIHDIFDAACNLAENRGLRVTGSELIGLIPLDSILNAGEHYLKKQNSNLGLPQADVIECAIKSLGLNDVIPFDPDTRIIEYAIKGNNRPLINMSGEKFLDELSRSSPAPGGGSVAAMVGAMAAALSSMVSSLNYGKKDYFNQRNLFEDAGKKSQNLKDDLKYLFDEDTHSFNRIIEANRLPEKNEQEKEQKIVKKQGAIKYAIDVPLSTAKNCFSILEIIQLIIPKVDHNSISDLGVSSEIAMAAVRSACMNVWINLNDVDSNQYRKKLISKTEKLIEDSKEIHNSNIDFIKNVIYD